MPARSRRSRLRLALPSAIALSLAAPARAQPVVIDRIVAVVGDEPILLSEVLARADALQESAAVQAGAGRAPAREKVSARVLSEMVDDALVRAQAKLLGLSVTDGDVDRAVDQVAAAAGLSQGELMAEAERHGLSEAAYRRELQRQVLDAKVQQVALSGRVVVSEDDVRAAYERQAAAGRRDAPYRPAWLVLRIPAGADAAATLGIEDEARKLAALARSGQDFASLVRDHSADEATRRRGGDLGERVPAGASSGLTLRKEVEAVALRLEVGQVSEPFRLGNAYVVLKLLSRAASPTITFEAAREGLTQRLYTEKMTAARKRWLEDLRRRTSIELRVVLPTTNEDK